MNSLANNFYFDPLSTAPLKAAVREGDKEGLKAVARQFEGMFVNMMLKSMRDATPEGTLFNSHQSRFYRDLSDQQLSQQLAEGGGIGIADMLVKQLGGPAESGQDTGQDTGRDSGKTHRGYSLGGNSLGGSDSRGGAYSLEAVPRVASLGSYYRGEGVPEAAAAEQGVKAKSGNWETPAAFIRDLWPQAEKVAQQLGVDPRLLVAQAALETGWGSKVPLRADGSSSLNLFGIKADSRWSGDRVVVDTVEFEQDRFERRQAAFRAYDSLADSFADYADFLRSNGRYQTALEQAADREAYPRELQKAGYATDPAYADKILRILNSDTLKDGLTTLNFPPDEPLDS